MFAQNKTAIFYLREKSLEIVVPKGSAYYEFSTEVIKDKQVLNQDKFKEEVIGFINKIDFKIQKSLILLADELVSEKIISKKESEDYEKELDLFKESIGFSPEKTTLLKLEEKEVFHIIIVNKNLYESLVRILENIDWNVISVLPASVYGSLTNGLDRENYKKIIKNKKILNNNLLLLKEKEIGLKINKDDYQAKKARKKEQYLVCFALIITLLFIITGVVLIILSNQNLNKLNNKVKVVSTTTTLQLKKEIKPKEKESVKITILNGSGISGQAGEIKKLLINEGFREENLETGNADDTETGDSILEYKQDIDEDLKKEIIYVLEAELGHLNVLENSKLEEDFLITTRK